MKKLILITLLSSLPMLMYGQLVHNSKRPADPATIPLDESKKGLVMDGEIEDLFTYPGTKRKYQVFVPKQYDGTTPACLVVGLDGNLFGAITVIDNLINSGEMPVTIGIFLDPGVCYHPDGSVARYNRSNEFDKTDRVFATFLEQEVIPRVEMMTTPDGRAIKISRDPNDRAITGASSSGIAAFTVAWERPDLFSRVYSSVGTFVAMRGGNEYPALIRKTEPKALRIYLQDGANDTWNHIFGDWWEYNQLMESALNFAGYEVMNRWDKGTHSIKYGTIAYPDAMRWLWRGWPRKVETGATMNGTLKEIIDPESQWEEVFELASFQTPPYPKGENIRLPRAAKSPVHTTLPLSNGDAYVSTSDGSIWFYCAKTDKWTKMNTLETGGPDMAIYPDNRLLVTSEKHSDWLISYIIRPDGTLYAGQRFYWLHNTSNHSQHPTGNMVFDTNGNLYVATYQGIQVCDQNGRVRAILTLPCGPVEKIWFDEEYIFVHSKGRLFTRKLLSTAHNSWEAPIEVKSQGQG
ncbi:MAG: hypothetical protein IKW65_04410 [Bacteroidales bacterium]|nr:hypothetical protein [Bacteroidales bacterium]